MNRCTTKILFAFFALTLACMNISCKPETIPVTDKKKPASMDAVTGCKTTGGIFDEEEYSCDCGENKTFDGKVCIEADSILSGSSKQVCEAMQGSWNLETNFCKCPESKNWNGTICVGTGSVANLKKSCESTLGKWSDTAGTCECSQGKYWTGSSCNERSDSAINADALLKLKNSCKAAAGTFKTPDNYCICPNKQVLAGSQCVPAKGVFSEEICTKAPLPGKFSTVSKTCQCADATEVFAAARGGCVRTYSGNVDYHKSMCENSLMDGSWKTDQNRCECPAGKIWHKEYCFVKANLSAKNLCTSDYSKGTWDQAKNSCRCPIGHIWSDQLCKSISEVTPKEACESEFNKGDWNTLQATCACPASSQWIAPLKMCDSGGVDPASDLCLRSGGTPTGEAGKCKCGTGLRTTILEPQKYQYCVNENGGSSGGTTNPDDDLPLWMKILLGLI